MISGYRGNANATTPQASDKPIFISLDGTFSVPTTVAFADSPYTIAASALPIQTFLVSTAGGAVTINLPAAPANGQIINIKRTTTDGTTLTIARNGKNIEGAAANFVDANPALSAYSFQYDNTSGSWWAITL